MTVERDGSARVADLARSFGVTEETVRRDLIRLEHQGRLARRHGGALRIETARAEQPYWEREVQHEAEKIAIAREALRRVRADETICLDASTSAWHMARRMGELPLTVVTNCARTAATLADCPRVRVILLADHSKLGTRALSVFAPLASVDELITDDGTPPDLAQAFRARQVRVTVVARDGKEPA